MSQGQVTKYKSRLDGALSSLDDSVLHLSQFVGDLESSGNQNEIEFIKKTLLPTIDKVKVDFDEMVGNTQDLLEEVNSDVEECVNELHNKRATINRLNKELARVEQKLKGKAKDVEYAEQKYRTKRQNLRAQEAALRQAEQNLNAAKKKSKNMKIAGGALFAIPIFGWIAGATMLTFDATALKDAINSCRGNRDDAAEEVESSEDDLQRAKRQKQAVIRQLSDLKRKREFKEEVFKDISAAIERLKKFQKIITEFHEDVRTCYRDMSDFYGKFNVLRGETDGGYSLSNLKSPTMTMLSSLSKLLQSPAIVDSFDASQLEAMKSHIRQMESVEWPSAVSFDGLV